MMKVHDVIACCGDSRLGQVVTAIFDRRQRVIQPALIRRCQHLGRATGDTAIVTGSSSQTRAPDKEPLTSAARRYAVIQCFVHRLRENMRRNSHRSNPRGVDKSRNELFNGDRLYTSHYCTSINSLVLYVCLLLSFIHRCERLYNNTIRTIKANKQTN